MTTNEITDRKSDSDTELGESRISQVKTIRVKKTTQSNESGWFDNLNC